MTSIASNSSTLRLGTRGSLLARSQSQLVAGALQTAHPGLSVDLIILKTTGDQIADRPLHEMGGKGLFTKELELALLAGQIDFAVHSFKDLPITQPLVEQADLIVAAVPKREDPADVLVSRIARSIDELPQGARIGTGSLRRRCQLLARRPDLRIEPVRGNIDTRLRKLGDAEFDAIVLASAGLSRTQLFDPAIMSSVPSDFILPAPGQGALALQCRRSDDRTRLLLQTLNDPASFLCVRAERALVRALRGDCLSPIAALAQVDSRLWLRAAVGAGGGEPPLLHAEVFAEPSGPEPAAQKLFEQLNQQGVMKILHG